MLRSTLLPIVQSKAVHALVTRMPVSRSVVARFVAGEGIDEAIRVVGDLAARGIAVTADHLGENVATERAAAAAADVYLGFLDAVEGAGLTSHISLKLTQFGLDLGEATCAGNLRRVLDRARAAATFVRVDMESSAYTDRTLAMVRAMKAIGYGNVGVVVQASLKRSGDDVARLCEEGIRVRLCKGAYKEPPDRALARKRDVDANYAHLMRALFDAAHVTPALYPAIATHDETLVRTAQRYARERGLDARNFEFQMLYGVRRGLQDAVSREGFNVRVYVPFGAEWYAYFTRRLAERPANLWFFVSNLFKR
jgi:proline dehydrogenase